MNYFDRLAQESLIETAKYNNTRAVINFADMAASGAVGTVVAIDGLTGRAIANVADGTARYQDISSSNQQGITSGAFSGGFNDGKTA
jgi:hypothetical protein